MTSWSKGSPVASPSAIGKRCRALQASIAGLCAENAPGAGLTRWAILGADAAADLWDAEGYRTVSMRLEKVERERGALESLRLTLGPLAHARMWAGNFVDAEVAHSEATEISVALGADRAIWEALKVELFAWQGRDEETRFIAELLMGELSHVAGGGVAVNLARIALTILNIAQRRYQDALVLGLSIMGDDPCPHGSQVLPEVVEAAIRTGDGESAQMAFARLRDRATASGTPWALGLLARCRALVTKNDPDPDYRQALDLLGATHVTTDLARTHLLFGEWLRREKRLTEARKPFGHGLRAIRDDGRGRICGADQGGARSNGRSDPEAPGRGSRGVDAARTTHSHPRGRWCNESGDRRAVVFERGDG